MLLNLAIETVLTDRVCKGGGGTNLRVSRFVSCRGREQYKILTCTGLANNALSKVNRESQQDAQYLVSTSEAN